LDHLDNTVSASVVGGDVRQQHLDLFIKKIVTTQPDATKSGK
jgi:hypothetical protein